MCWGRLCAVAHKNWRGRAELSLGCFHAITATQAGTLTIEVQRLLLLHGIWAVMPPSAKYLARFPGPQGFPRFTCTVTRCHSDVTPLAPVACFALFSVGWFSDRKVLPSDI
jgi:hypothetical protein